jgi:AcrR family transcriptional regulator
VTRDDRRRSRDLRRDLRREDRGDRRAARAERRAPDAGRGAERDGETRQRLLEVAAELFADRGLDGVTVRELCSAARANVAAINYHFGDKLGLYAELIEQAIQGMRRNIDLAATEGTAEERLAAYIRGEIERVLTSSPGSWVRRLMNREVDAPTPMLDRVVREAIQPRADYVARLVAELMRCPTDDPRVGVAVANIRGLPAVLRRSGIFHRLLPRFRATPETIQFTADTTTRFVLAGIRELARDRPTVKP